MHGSLFFVAQIPSVTHAIISPERGPFSVSKAQSFRGRTVARQRLVLGPAGKM